MTNLESRYRQIAKRRKAERVFVLLLWLALAFAAGCGAVKYWGAL